MLTGLRQTFQGTGAAHASSQVRKGPEKKAFVRGILGVPGRHILNGLDGKCLVLWWS